MPVGVVNHWSEREEGGNRFWLEFIRWAILNVGRRFARLAMGPTALYFLIRRGPERRASRDWLRRHPDTAAGLRGPLRHIHTFAMTIVDRVLLLSGRTDELDIRAEGNTAVHESLAQGRGCLLLGSHLGSFEAVRVLSRDLPGTRLRVVMDRNQNALMTRLLESLDPGIAATVIDAGRPGTEIVLEISRTLEEGQMAAMLADRVHRREPSIRVPFMGQPAAFPVSPFLIASLSRVPVFLVFGLFEGSNRYRLVFECLTERMNIDRRNRQRDLEYWVGRYATRLEHYAREYPYNWFNFYDFWNSSTTGSPANDSRHPAGTARDGSGRPG